ncbi:NUDIX hydrolase [Microbacteriaceae bacterium VKM Ac-2854]|nr:NUDIX hydrolase [Microbacteriaceae bacterium VKM Ac-2854]
MSENWVTLRRREVYRGRMRIEEHEVELPTGERTRFEVDRSIPYAVAVLLIRGDRLVLAREYRYAIDRWILNLPGGAGDTGEEPRLAAARECREELGMEPLDLAPLHTFFPNPGRSAWASHLFVATATAPARRDDSDPAEQVHLVELAVAELDALILGGEVVDPALLIARSMAGARGLLPPLGAG